MRVLVICAEDRRALAAALADGAPPTEVFDLAFAGDDLLQREHDAVVLLWSKELAPINAAFEGAALDAWENDRLVVIALDGSELPFGLRDLPVIEARVPQQQRTRMRTVGMLLRGAPNMGIDRAFAEFISGRLDSVAHAQAPPASAPSTAGAPSPAGAPARPPRELAAYSRGRPAWIWICGIVIAFAALFAVGLGREAVTAAVVAVLIGIAFYAYFREQAKRSESLPTSVEGTGQVTAESSIKHQRVESALPAQADLFVSYARADLDVVDQILVTIAAAGRQVWIDRAAIRYGQNWAGEIVRAIKESKAVLVMCSPRAFQSDHVKREVYLADKYKKPIMPIFVEAAEPSDDFDYFLAGVQRFEWYRLEQQDRRAAVTAALAAI